MSAGVSIDDIFDGSDPIAVFSRWMGEAVVSELNDPNAMALATVDEDGLPNVRMVLLKDIEPDAFVFYTNYGSVKAQEIIASGKAAFALHWKSLRRQVRVRGTVEKEDGPKSDAYYASRSLKSRLGAWASEQSQPIESRDQLMSQLEVVTETHGDTPQRPPFWGGFRIIPTEIELWADGAHRLHNRFRYTRAQPGEEWSKVRLSP
ncbi:MAG: pyridoxamine 5'-phosphate oxidase [Pseudomonadota bacterium]